MTGHLDHAEHIEADTNAEGLRFAVIASRLNPEIVDGLLRGAIDCLGEHGTGPEGIRVYRVPGAFEIPLIASLVAKTRQFDAIVAIGALVRGDTPHFEYISTQVTMDLSRAALESGVPVAYGVITCNTIEQAEARSGSGSGNKGWEAALAAIEMANLIKKLTAI